MKTFKILSIVGLIAVMSLALSAQEPQGRGGQGAPEGGAARGGQVPPVPDGAAGGPGGRGNRGGGGAGGGGAAPRGGGGGPKNIQVLTGADLPSTMQGFVQALGLLEKGTCSYCHAEDRSSDEKRPKVVARRMITMMRAINGTFGDGKPHVTCYTCHRGSTTPLTEPPLN
jgi:hypothetical protein